MVVRAAVTALAAALLWFVSVPAEPAIRLCGFHWLTGRPCPLCGLTRALFELGKGRWHSALRFNALSPLASLLLLSLVWPNRWRGLLWRIGLLAFALYGGVRLFFPAV
jgi:hypothetical protein